MSKTPSIRFSGFTEDWEQRKLGDMGEVITGSTPSTQHPEYYSEDGIPWVTPTDITENVISDTSRKLSPLGAQVGRVVPEETILVTCIASIGKNTMLANKGSFNQQINGLVPKKHEYDPYFLLTESTLWSAKMKREAAAGTMQIVNKNEFSAIKTLVPRLPEQQAIGGYFRKTDNLITYYQRKYEKLVNIKKSMLYKMFPQNGSKIPEMRFDGFTGDWEQRKLSEIVSVCSGRDYKHLSEGPIPVYGTGGYMLSVNKALSYERNAIGIGRKGTIDKPYVLNAPFWTVDTLFYAVPKYSECLDFVHNVFQNIDWKKKDESTGVPSLSKEAINNTEIMVPKVEEQLLIGNFFAQLDNHITLHQRKFEKLKQIKQAMLHKMFV